MVSFVLMGWRDFFINGLGMMLYQGAASFKLWTDQDMPIDVVKEALDF